MNVPAEIDETDVATFDARALTLGASLIDQASALLAGRDGDERVVLVGAVRWPPTADASELSGVGALLIAMAVSGWAHDSGRSRAELLDDLRLGLVEVVAAGLPP